MKIKFSRSLKDTYYKLKEISNLNGLDNYILDEYLTTNYSKITSDTIEAILKETKSNNKVEAFKEAFYQLFDLSEEDNELALLNENNKFSDFKLLNSRIVNDNEYFKFISSLNLDDMAFNSIKLEKNYYEPYEGFLFDEVKLVSFYEQNNLGFFDERVYYYNLLDDKENYNVWMNITPFEINTMKDNIKEATGNVLTVGLGLAYFPFMVSNKDDVESITIVENNKDIYDFINNNLISKFKYKSKIKLVYEDMYSYINSNSLTDFNYIFIDTYHQAIEAIPVYFKLLKKLTDSNVTYSFWIENSILVEIRRFIFLLVSFEFEKSLKKEYFFNDDEKYILEKLALLLKDYSIENENDLLSLLEIKSIKKMLIEGLSHE